MSAPAWASSRFKSAPGVSNEGTPDQIARGRQALPILDGKDTAAKLYQSCPPQALQCPVNSHDGHAQGFADLGLAERRGTGISFCDAARARPVEQFAEQMRKSSLGVSATVTGDRLAEDCGIDQRFPPHRESKRGNLPDAQSLFLDRMDHAVCAIGDAELAFMPHKEMLRAFERRREVALPDEILVGLKRSAMKR